MTTMTTTTIMQSCNVKTAAIDERDRVVGALVLAFSRDPVARWAFPEPRQYLEAFEELVLAFGGSAFAHGTAHCLDDHSGAALWLPPGVKPDEERLMSLFERAVDPQRLDDLMSVFQQMDSFHPRQPHWHLPMLGVCPIRQGEGRGSALLRYALERIDRQGGAPVYLESSSPANVPLYERFGFEVIGSIQAGSSPRLHPMMRQAR